MNTRCIPVSSGPGRSRALAATRSSNRSHFMLRRQSVASGDSNWKTPAVRPDPQRARHGPESSACLEGSERDDLPDRIPAIALAHVLDDLAAPLEAEVEVDVGHRDTLGIQEPLEQ